MEAYGDQKPEDKFTKRSGTTNKGIEYEDLLTALLAFKLSENNEIKNFSLSTNNSQYGDFDDIVLQYELDNVDSKHTFVVQMKHKNENKKLTSTNLAAAQGKFSIQSYFKSFETFRHRLQDNFSCVLYTTARCEFSENYEFPLENFANLKLRVRQHNCLDENFPNTSAKSFVYKFEIVNDEDTVSESFRDFLDHLFLYPNQKDVPHLKEYISTEFRKTYFCKENEFLWYTKYISSWSACERKKMVLNKNTTTAKIAEILLKPHLSTGSLSSKDFDFDLFSKTCQQCDIGVTSFDLHFSLFCDELPNEEKSLNIKEKFQINSESEEDRAVILWHMLKSPLIIRLNKGNEKTIYKAIRSFENKGSGRKFILISDSVDRAQLQNFKLLWTLDDLLSICGEEIKDKKIALQGRQFLLKDIMFKKIFQILTIDEVLKQDIIQVGENAEELPNPYIDQRLSKITISFKFINNLDAQSLAVINCNGKLDSIKQHIENARIIKVEKFLKNRSKEEEHQFLYRRTMVVVAKNRCSPEQFMNICQKSKDKNCYLLCINKQLKLELLETSRVIAKPRGENLERLTIKEDEMFEDNHYVNVISAKPGAGKSVMMKYLKNNISSDYWILNICVRDHVKFYTSTTKDILDNFLNFQSENMGYNSLTLNIRHAYEKEKKIVFLWDGLDELPMTYIPKAIQVIKILCNMGYVNWITTRDHLQHFLEENFRIFSHTINEMDQDLQKNYIRKQFETKHDPQELTEVIEKIITVIAMTRDVAFLGIPLRIYMLTDLFLKNPQTCRELLDSTFILPDIIHHFVQEKCKFSYKDKGNYSNFENDFMHRALNGNTQYRLLQYEILALNTLLPSEVIDRLKIHHELLNDVEQIKDDFGLLSKIDLPSKTAVFVHSIYAEYFVATWMVKNRDQTDIFKSFMFETSYRTIRIMFDLILSKGCPAHIAILHRDYSNLLKHQDDINSKDKAGRTPLHLICSWGEPHPLLESETKDDKYFLKNTNKANLTKIASTTEEYKKCLRVLLENTQCKPKEKDELFCWDAVEYADRTLSLLAIDILLKYLEIAVKDLENFRDELSVSYYSIVLNYKGIVNCLNNMKYIIDRQTGNNLLHLAVINGRNHFLNKLLSIPKYIENINENNHQRQIVPELVVMGTRIIFESKQNSLHIAAQTGNVAALDILTKKGASINYQNGMGNTALHIVIMTGRLQLIPFLLHEGSSVNLPDNNNNTSLHYIVQTGELSMIKDIVDRETYIIKNNLGQSPLDLATIQNREDILDLLLTKSLPGKNISIQGYMQMPLSNAVFTGQVKILHCLIKHGVNVNAMLKNVTILCIAAFRRHIEIVDLLLRKGADPNIRVFGNMNALSFAVISQNIEIIKLLLSHNVEIFDSDHGGNTCLIKAVTDENKEIVDMLLKHGVNVNARNNRGASAMHFAAAIGNIYLINTLLKYNGDVNIKNKKGGTPLHVAVLYERKKAIEFLIRNGADCRIAAQGLVPLMLKKLPLQEIDRFPHFNRPLMQGTNKSAVVPEITINFEMGIKSHPNPFL
ncbi:uncharacterized protein LOC135138401 [Zophobas morio]|uniref:uncharacterized protein LOC135138401 n=1 Tax=Zophobas morio TaxID=2755281 RepID=UPI003083AE0B